MKEITRIEKVYDFDELSDSAKEKARNEYLNYFRCAEDFETFCIDDLANNHFPDSDLKVEFSLSSCQGDGFNIYGKMKLSEAIDFVMSKTDKLNENIRFFNWLKTLDYEIELSQNKARYTYCYVDYSIFAIDIECMLGYDGYTSNNKNHFSMLCKFDKEFKQYIKELCKEYEKDGYKYFYEVDDEEIKEMWESNGYLGFYEDGSHCYS